MVQINDRIKAHRSAPDVYDAPTFDQMAYRIEELEAKLGKATGALVRVAGQKTYADDPWTIARTTLEELKALHMLEPKASELARRLQSKIDKQTAEISRLIRQVEALRKANAKLLTDLKWMRGEKSD